MKFFPQNYVLEAFLGKIARKLDATNASGKQVTKPTVEKCKQASSEYCRNKQIFMKLDICVDVRRLGPKDS